MADGQPTPKQRPRRRWPLSATESAGAGAGAGDPSSPSMAVSIVGVSTACSKDALASSAEAVRKKLAPE